MFTVSTALTRRGLLAAAAAAGVGGLILLAAGWRYARPSEEAQSPVAAAVPTAREVLGPAPVVPIADQPPAKLHVDPPKAEPLARGVAYILFRTENLRVQPVFGPATAAVSPRIGHLHVTVDDAPWHWAHTSDGPVIVAELAPGPHTILLELADANHKVLTQEVVKFEVPRS